MSRYKEQQALNEKLEEWTKTHTVFGTLKFANGYITPEDKADRLHRLFWNKMDRTYFPSAAVKKGIRIPRVCFKHFGFSGENIHYHFTAQAHDISTFMKTAEAHWFDLDKYTHDIEITKIRNRHEAYHYLAHEYLEIGSNTFDEKTTHITEQANDAFEYKDISQLRRILKTHQQDNGTYT